MAKKKASKKRTTAKHPRKAAAQEQAAVERVTILVPKDLADMIDKLHMTNPDLAKSMVKGCLEDSDALTAPYGIKSVKILASNPKKIGAKGKSTNWDKVC